MQAKKLCVIWSACIWILWNGHNEKVFRDSSRSTEQMSEEIKIATWKWLKCEVKGFNYSLNHWIINLASCLGIICWTTTVPFVCQLKKILVEIIITSRVTSILFRLVDFESRRCFGKIKRFRRSSVFLFRSSAHLRQFRSYFVRPVVCFWCMLSTYTSFSYYYHRNFSFSFKIIDYSTNFNYAAGIIMEQN